MRVATSELFRSMNSQLGARQTELGRLQEQIATGKRILRPSDDPSGAARVLDANRAIGQLEQFDKNGVVLAQELALEESTLDSVTNLLQRTRELAIAANSGTQSPQSRGAYRAEVEESFEALVSLANTRNANGDYLFAGFEGQTKPFSSSNGQVSYAGDQGQRHLQVADGRQIAGPESGHAIFEQVRNGNGAFAVAAAPANLGTGIIAGGSVSDASAFQAHQFTVRFTAADTYDVIDDTTGTAVMSAQPYVSGDAIGFNGIETSITGAPATGDEFTISPSANQNIFQTLRNFVTATAADAAGPADAAQYTQAMSGVLADIDSALNHVLDVRASAGARLNALEATTRENEAVKAELEVALSRTRDVDIVEAISKLELELGTLQAIQQSFVRIEELSLFNFLR